MKNNNNVITAEELPLDEKIYLKKGLFGYRLVYPIKNEDGTINWINLIFGGKVNIIPLLSQTLILLFLIFAYLKDINAARDILENTFDYCSKYLMGGYAK